VVAKRNWRLGMADVTCIVFSRINGYLKTYRRSISLPDCKHNRIPATLFNLIKAKVIVLHVLKNFCVMKFFNRRYHRQILPRKFFRWK